MSATPVATIDALNGLLEAELNSIFRFMGSGSPYLSRANSEVRKPLEEMVVAGQKRSAELAQMIESLGGTPVPPSIQPEEQYLSFLTLKFLLPKLLDAKNLIIRRYHNAQRALKGVAAPEVLKLLGRHVEEMETDLQVLEKASAEVLAQSRKG